MIKLKYLSAEKLSPVWELEFGETVTQAINKKYISFLENEYMEIEAGFDKNQVQVKTTLKKKDGSVNYPIEAVYLLDDNSKLEPADAAKLMLDYLDAYWNEYFTENRDVYVLLDWSKHSCDGYDFYLRGFVRNEGLESEADALLRQHGFGTYDIEPISNET